MARSCCPWCYLNTDWIDRKTTKCPECVADLAPEGDWVNRQTAEGVVAYLRAKELKREEKERLQR
jgi:hypothetical protein